MKVKIVILMILFLSFFSITFSYNYNESWTDIYLDSNGWCNYIPINFKVWNKTDYLNKDNIKSDLCEADEKPAEDDCLEFSDIKEFDVKIYSGPLDSLPIIFEKKYKTPIDEFEYTFENENSYLIEVIFPSGAKYNDYHELKDVYKCKGAVPKEPETFNYSLSINKFELNLENTNIENISQIKIEDIKDFSIYPKLDNMPKIIKIESPSNFSSTKSSISIDFPKINVLDEIKLYELNLGIWESTSHKELNNKIIIEDFKPNSVYSIVYKEYIEPVVIIEDKNETKIENDLSNDGEIINNTKIETRENNNLTYFIIIIFIILGGLGFYFINNTNNRSNYHDNKELQDENKTENNKQEHQEVLSSYNQVYTNTKTYVNTYKDKFGKDEIYRALKSSNVPNDIIDKVFLEEYS